MPVIKHDPDFAELVDLAAERRNRSTDQWNRSIYELYGSTVDPIIAIFHKMTRKIAPLDSTSNPTADGIIPIPTSKFLKYSSLAYILLIGPLMYPRGIVIIFAILTLLFRLSDHALRESTAVISDALDLIINIYFILEGIIRLSTIPAVFEVRRRYFESLERPANSLAYEILRCGWIEILISFLSIAISSQYDNTNAICWFNLFRLSFIANFFILELPQIEVLLSGIYSGLRSIASTWFLLLITFVIYGVLCTASFRDNDPGHFSTVGTSMFTLFRVSTMDNWSEVNYINAYGCDSVPSNYLIISRNDTRPRYIDVFSGRMYLFLCESPTYHPYLSSLIFTSFVVLTGFMLISLTVAAVSGGVHMRLDQVQKLDNLVETEIDLVDTISEDDETPMEEKEIEVRRTMRTHTFFGKGPEKVLNNEQSNASVNPSSTSRGLIITGGLIEKPSLMLMTSPVEEGDEKEDFEDEEALENDDIERSEADRPRTYSDIATDSRSFENGNSQSYRSGDDIGFWQMSASSDTDDELEVIVRPIPKTQAIEHLTREESLSSTREECLSSTREESLSSTREESISSPEHLTQTVISMSQPTPPESSLSITEVASHKIPRPPRKSMKPTHSQPKIQLPLLQDKELLRMMLTQMWKDVERKKENTAEDTSEISDEVLSSSSRLTRLLSSLSDTSRQSTVASPSRLSHPSGHLLRHSSFHQQSDTTAFDSTKRIAYFLKNILSTYYYIGYIILIVLVTASFQIYCTNKNNCPDFWGVFVAVQILLSADIFFRIIIHYPTYTTFFLSKNNLFDMFMVLIIWIPVYYTGYGSQIAASARIVYLLRLLPFLAWITDLQVILLSVVSSFRPLLYVVGMMFLMFFHFAVAGVLIFKRNDEFYFGSLYRAMNALFQVCTLDNWGDIALKNMYGCDYYGSDTGIDQVDSLCQTPQGLGWVAAWYFVTFITFSVMILQSLFIGIIISAMELLKDRVSQEAEMWKIIYQRVDKFGIQNSTLRNLLDIFNALDSNLNGYLTVKDLEPLLKVLPPMNNLPQVNCKVNGHYNFPEFIDLLYVIGIKLHKISRSSRGS